MTVEERIEQDAAQWRAGYAAPSFDATFERALAAPPRRRRRAWLAAAAAVVLIAAIATFAATRSAQHSNQPAAPSDRWITRSLAGAATVQVPARWFATRYRGIARYDDPLAFFSTAKFSGPCSTGPQQSACTSPTWFAPGWTTPADGVLVLWSQFEFPGTSGAALRHVPGRRVVIDGRPAKLRSGAATSSCPAGAATEIDAYIRAWGFYPGERLDLTACLGRHVSRVDRAAVQRMLRSLHIRSR